MLRVALLIVFAGLMAVSPAMGQQVTPALQLSVNVNAVQLGPNETASVELTARNTGTAAGSVTLRTNSVTGWTVQLSETSFTLNGGSSRIVTIALATGTAGTQAPRNGTLNVNGDIAFGNGQQGSPGATQLSLGYVAPAPPPPPPPPPSLVGPIIGATSAVLLVALAVYLWQASRVRLVVPATHQMVLQGSPATYRVEVQNRARNGQTIELRVRQLEQPWAAAFSFPTVKLRGNESSDVPLCVLPPLGARPGSRVQFRIEARPNRFSPWLVRKKISSSVVVLPPPGPAAPSAEPPKVTLV